MGQNDEAVLLRFAQLRFDPNARRTAEDVWIPPSDGNLAPKLECSKGRRFTEDILDRHSDEYIVQEKLDGHMLAFTGKQALGKSGKVYRTIPAEFSQFALPAGIPLIGELYRGPGWSCGSLNGKDTPPGGSLKQTRAHQAKWFLSKYVVFDIPGLTRTPYHQRHAALKAAVQRWNHDVAVYLKTTVDRLPLQCINIYPATTWLPLLQEVIEQPARRAYVPWGLLPSVVEADAKASADGVTPGKQRTSLCAPPGEGLVFYQRNAGWLSRGDTVNAKQYNIPVYVKLKPRIMLPGRIVSEAPTLWNHGVVVGYKVRVSYWHPTRHVVLHVEALIPVGAHTVETVARKYANGRLVFMTCLGVNFSTGNIKPVPVVTSNLLPSQIACLRGAVQAHPELQHMTRLLQSLDVNAKADLLEVMCGSAAVLPLHPPCHWAFERLCFTTGTDARHVSLPRLRASQKFIDLFNLTGSEYRATLIDGNDGMTVAVPTRGVVKHVDTIVAACHRVGVGNLTEGRRLEGFVGAMSYALTRAGGGSVLVPLYATEAGGSVLNEGLVTRWCDIIVDGVVTSYACWCQRVILTCCARVWRDIEGTVDNCREGDPNVLSAHSEAFVERVRHSVSQVAHHWNRCFSDVLGGETGDLAFAQDYETPLQLILVFLFHFLSDVNKRTQNRRTKNKRKWGNPPNRVWTLGQAQLARFESVAAAEAFSGGQILEAYQAKSFQLIDHLPSSRRSAKQELATRLPGNDEEGSIVHQLMQLNDAWL
jgi:hypothetical protein